MQTVFLLLNFILHLFFDAKMSFEHKLVEFQTMYKKTIVQKYFLQRETESSELKITSNSLHQLLELSMAEGTAFADTIIIYKW